jgi:hypothetical protein
MGKVLDFFGGYEAPKDVGDDFDGRGPGISIRENTKTTQAEIPVLYGELRIGGNRVYYGFAGANNKDLWMVLTLSEGECEGIAQIEGVDQIFLDDKIYTDFGGLVSYWFHAGTSTQTYDTNLNAVLPEWEDAQRYLAYMVFKCEYDKNYFQRVPKFNVVLKGRKVYDFRDATTAYSNNLVLCLHDYITSDRYGPGLATAKIDYPSWISAANYCDLKGFELNMLISKNKNSGNIIDEIKAHGRLRMNWFNGKYSLRYADLNYEAVAMELTDDHLAQGRDGKLNVSLAEPTSFKRPHGLKIKWRDPDNAYVEDDLPVGDQVGDIKTYNLLGCTDRQQAGIMGTYVLERAILDRTLTASLRDDALRLEPWDIVKATWTDFGLTDQYLRVRGVELSPEGHVGVKFAYEALALYNDVFDLVVADVYECTLPDPTEVPPSVTDVILAEELYDYRLRTFTRLNVTYIGPSFAWFIGVNVYLSYDNVNWEFFGFVESGPASQGDFSIDPVEEGTTYYLILASVSLHGPEQSLAAGFKGARTILGYDTVPPSLYALFAVANANCVNLYADKLPSPDIEIYEFRLGGWSGGIFLASLRSPNLSLYGVKPGSHTFYCNTLSNNGFYGETPRSAAVVLLEPPSGWTVQNTETCDYTETGDDHKNTEADVYDSDDVLKCSHAGFITNTGTKVLHGATDTYSRGQAWLPFLDIPVLNFFQLYLKRTGSPTGSIRAYIYDDDSGPDSIVAVSDDVTVSGIGTSLEWVTFNFSTPPALIKDTKYYLVIKGGDFSGSSGNTIEWGFDSAGGWGTNRWYDTGAGWTEYADEDQNFKADIYTGRYTSPEYNRGASNTYLIYLLADLTVTGAGTTWADVIPSPDEWREIGITERTWQEIFELEEAPEVHVKVYWGDVSGSLSNSAEKQEILSVVATGQYFQYEITIRDPSDAIEVLVHDFSAKFCQ